MEQGQINYSEIIDLGFKEEIHEEDKVFFKTHGFDYSIITMKLTKKIYLDWSKETKLCELVRMNSAKKCDILARLPIMNYKHLRDIIEFYVNDPKSDPLFV